MLFTLRQRCTPSLSLVSFNFFLTTPSQINLRNKPSSMQCITLVLDNSDNKNNLSCCGIMRTINWCKTCDSVLMIAFAQKHILSATVSGSPVQSMKIFSFTWQIFLGICASKNTVVPSSPDISQTRVFVFLNEHKQTLIFNKLLRQGNPQMVWSGYSNLQLNEKQMHAQLWCYSAICCRLSQAVEFDG